MREARFDSLEPGDIEEAMNAAARIGDDTLQRQAGRAVRPESFTHGTSEQRQRWFATGFRDAGTSPPATPSRRASSDDFRLGARAGPR